MSQTKPFASTRKMIPKILPVILMLGGFVFFVIRDREEAKAEGPEEVLVNMAIALGEGQVEKFVACFGGELGRSLRAIVEENDAQEVSKWLKIRGEQIKGFAITEVEPVNSAQVLVKTETVYENRNSGQNFLLGLEGEDWRIIESDFEAIQEWETNFGKPIWEVP